MKKPSFYINYNRSETQFVQEYCFKKLNVNSTFQLNDKFEGRAFYDNFLKKYMVSKFILTKVFNNKVSELDDEKIINWDFVSHFLNKKSKLFITEDIIKIDELLKNNDIVVFINLQGLRVQLYCNGGVNFNNLTINI